MLMVLASVSLTAAEFEPPARTPDQLVAEALQNHPELRFYEAELEAARAGRRSAGRLADPEVSASAGLKSQRSDGVISDGIAWSASVMQPFEWPGRMGLRKAIANRDIELAELGLERFKVALAGRVRLLAFGVAAARDQETAAREVAERFTALREVLVQRDPAGLTPLLETRVIEATELNARRRANDALLHRESAQRELNRVRNMPLDSPIVIVLDDRRLSPLTNASEWVAVASTNSFELRSLKAELEQQKLEVRLARHGRFPSIAAGPTYSEERAGSDREQVIGLGISLPLPLWNRNRDVADVARARELQAETVLAVELRRIEDRVLSAVHAYEIRRREMDQWRPDAIRHFREAAELADRHYRLGAVPVSTYVELQKQYLEAIEGLIETRRGALEAAIELELLTGTSPRIRETAGAP